LPCTFVGWVPILDFDLWGISSLYTRSQGQNRNIKFKLPQVLINAELYGIIGPKVEKRKPSNLRGQFATLGANVQAFINILRSMF
jgi:hypothetical protein